MELTVSPIRKYNLTICEGRVVVRSIARINALLDVWTKDIDVKYRRILADVAFDGAGSDEEIIWSTDVFHTTPKRLSELNDSDAESYRKIFGIKAYKEANSYICCYICDIYIYNV